MSDGQAPGEEQPADWDKPRATWQYLLYLMMDTDMSPSQILGYLQVKPSRLKKLMGSKRLNERLAAMQSMSVARARHIAVCWSDQALRNLLRLVEHGRDESSRGASRDMLVVAAEMLKGRSGPIRLDEPLGSRPDGLPRLAAGVLTAGLSAQEAKPSQPAERSGASHSNKNDCEKPPGGEGVK